MRLKKDEKLIKSKNYQEAPKIYIYIYIFFFFLLNFNVNTIKLKKESTRGEVCLTSGD